MEFEDKVSRADLKYIPLCKSLTEVMGSIIKTPEDRELVINILGNYIDE